MQGPRRGAVDHLGNVLGVAAIGLLHEQPAQLLVTAFLGFPPPEEAGKPCMKAGKGRRHLTELRSIHRAPPRRHLLALPVLP